MDIPESVFIGGLFGASMLGLMDNDEQLVVKPLYSSLVIRFEREFDPTPIIKEVIKDAFLTISKIHLLLEFTKKFEMKVWRDPKDREINPIFTFGLCTYNSLKKDNFFTIILRDSSGLPMVSNITLLRHLIKKLKKNKVQYEIW